MFKVPTISWNITAKVFVSIINDTDVIDDCRHIVDMCPLTKFEGGLNLLHEVDDDAVIWLEAPCSTREMKWINDMF